MTAFSREQYQDSEGDLIWEVRSVNHRYLEMSMVIPNELRAIEPVIREHISQRLQRGKVDCILRYQPAGDKQIVELQLNKPLVQMLHAASQEIAQIWDGIHTPSALTIMRWPRVLQEKTPDLNSVRDNAIILFKYTLESLISTRIREGTRLESVLRARCQKLQQHALDIRAAVPKMLANIRQQLQDKLKEFITQVDPLRLEQEMLLLIQRLDIEEEIDRILAHLAEIERVITQDSIVGRRLDFLMQELNRETNTVTSKVGDVAITYRAVDMKVLIEQMREQIQNIE